MPYQQSVPIPFAKNAYQARSRPLSSQRLVNWYAEAAPEDGKTRIVLYGTPGTKTFASFGILQTEEGPELQTESGAPLELEEADVIHGLHVMAGQLFVVSGENVYIVNASGEPTFIGGIGSNDAVVQMEDNGTQLVILKNDGTAYVATTSSVVQITDPNFQSASSVTIMDGYHIFSKTDSDQFFISGLNDALTYDALDFATAEGRPDKLVAVFADHREVWLFGTETIEIWYNSGDADFPFARIQGAFIERGCASSLSISKEANTIYWLGDDGVVYAASQYAPQRISTHAIEKAISEKDSISDAISYIYTQEGHKFYVLSFPNSGGTFVYDIVTGLWHERETFEENVWRPQLHAFAYNKNIVAGTSSSTISELDLDTYTENGRTIQSIAISPNAFDNTNRIIYDRLRVDIDAGVGLNTGQGSDPQAMLSWSDDGGNTFGNERFVTFGKIGEYKQRLIWRSLGQTRERIWKLVITDPVKRHVLGAYADVRVGRP